MIAREFLTNLSIILSIMAIGALLETAVPSGDSSSSSSPCGRLGFRRRRC